MSLNFICFLFMCTSCDGCRAACNFKFTSKDSTSFLSCWNIKTSSVSLSFYVPISLTLSSETWCCSATTNKLPNDKISPSLFLPFCFKLAWTTHSSWNLTFVCEDKKFPPLPLPLNEYNFADLKEAVAASNVVWLFSSSSFI